MLVVSAPGYWMNETSGVLRPAVEAYLFERQMTPDQVATMRAYLWQWIAGDWMAAGDEIDRLRADINGLDSQAKIRAWLDRADQIGIDPL